MNPQRTGQEVCVAGEVPRADRQLPQHDRRPHDHLAGMGSNGVTVTKFLQLLVELYLELLLEPNLYREFHLLADWVGLT